MAKKEYKARVRVPYSLTKNSTVRVNECVVSGIVAKSEKLAKKRALTEAERLFRHAEAAELIGISRVKSDGSLVKPDILDDLPADVIRMGILEPDHKKKSGTDLVPTKPPVASKPPVSRVKAPTYCVYNDPLTEGILQLCKGDEI